MDTNQALRTKYATDDSYRSDILKRRREHYAANREDKLAYAVDWKKANPQRLAQYQDNRRGSAKALVSSAKYRAQKLGLPFNLTIADIVVPSHCPVLGIPLLSGRGALTASSPTLDRQIPALGYVKGNVSVISMRANLIKTDATCEEIERVAAWMRAQEAAP